MNQPTEEEINAACEETITEIFDILEHLPAEYQTYTLALNLLYNLNYHVIKTCSTNEMTEAANMTNQNARYRMFTDLQKAVLVRLQHLDEREFKEAKREASLKK